MNLIVNGEATSLDVTSLDEVLTTLGYADLIVATAVNGRFVPASQRSQVVLAAGDKLDILAPMQGG